MVRSADQTELGATHTSTEPNATPGGTSNEVPLSLLSARHIRRARALIALTVRPRFSSARSGSHYFPLELGSRWTLAGEENGALIEVVTRVPSETEVVGVGLIDGPISLVSCRLSN